MATGGSGSIGTPDPVVWREGAPKDGGPAFPVPRDSGRPGMSLRDWFAGMALGGFTDHDRETAAQAAKDDGRDLADVLASWAYAIADAMLAAREGK